MHCYFQAVRLCFAQEESADMMQIIVSFLAGLIYGSLVSFLNSRITKNALLGNRKEAGDGVGKVMAVNVLRLAVSAGALLLVFLLRRILPMHFGAAMFGTAAGLTFISYLFLWLMLRNKK